MEHGVHVQEVASISQENVLECRCVGTRVHKQVAGAHLPRVTESYVAHVADDGEAPVFDEHGVYVVKCDLAPPVLLLVLKAEECAAGE